MRKTGLGIRLGNASGSEDDDQTPRRRGQRAETLPSSTGPPEVSPPANLDLPEDPKTWTPSQLSTNLASTLRAGNADLPQPVAKDIAAFVRENRITGKAFMRLSEDDLIQYGINQLWRYTLLASSRSLRQSTLRGRIWGFGNTPDPQTQLDEDPGNLSSSSTSSDVRRTRSRHSSSASESAGRVRDMVESLERTKQLEEEERSRSTSPTKMHQRERRPSNASASPSKHSRPLPQRGNVSDLFAMPDNQIAGTESEAAVEEKEGDATITGVAKRNVHGREPRMLPFPPTHTGGAYPYPQAIPALTPSHTGAAYPLPMSPQQTGYGASDYELGFRSPTHHQHRSPHGHPDPNTQVYVVRHNPSPSRQVEGEVKPASGRRSHGKRLLPYPPVVGQAELHHPRRGGSLVLHSRYGL
ncbi:hypothetical protein NLJ89_g10658 [Agrocybe chaxingu]|uniref:DUF1720 domain-containing protein n=1 Tax=Agrocybe chaxingu TaxID=84603 RepID=A0A9W8JY94_9AGAR|nr:hypothetical protein NLJ89_g10658 [Agrocybe chaxingu]